MIESARLLLALVVIASFTHTAIGQGTIGGVVTDPRGSFLQGAEIIVEGTGLATTTDRTGRYRIDGVPAGEQRVTVSFLGLEPTTESVSVADQQSAKVDIQLESDTVVLAEMVVESIAEGQARAINRQRASDTISNIVASDALGRLPDASVGEALSRLPGISVQKDRGEPEFITVRGAGPQFNSVSLNGDRIPSVSDISEERDDRSVSLNTVPTDLIAGIEVTKAVTPDMDADAVGAAVNLLTKSSLDYDRRVIAGKLEYGYNDIRESDQYSGNFTFGDRYADGKVGLLLSAAYQYNNRGIDAINAEYREATVDGVTYTDVFDELDLRHRYLDRVRQGASGQLDFRTSDDSTHYVRGFYNRFEDREERRRLRLRFGSGGTYLTGTTDTTGSIDRGRVVRRDRSGTKQTDMMNLGAGGKWEKEKFQLDYAISYASSDFTIQRTEADWEYRMGDYASADGIADWTYDRTNVDRPLIGDPFGHIANYDRQEIGNRGSYGVRDDESSENDTSGGVNLKIPVLLGENHGYWKVGLRYRDKSKDSRPKGESYAWDGDEDLVLSSFLDPDEEARIFDRYSIGPTTDMVALREFFYANLDSFELDETAFIQENLPGTYTADETITGAYLMAAMDIGKLHLVGGVRYEQTSHDYTGYILEFSEDGDLVGSQQVVGSSDYDDFFPSIVGTYHLRENILVRAAWTNTIARADYGALTPRQVINREEETVVEGNPELSPLTSMNWDLSFEWYLESGGILSVAGFYKSIDDFTYYAVSEIDSGTFAGYELTRPENGPSGTIRGLEFSWSMPLKMLPAPFNGLGIQANYSIVDGESEIPGRGTVEFIPDQIDRVYNLQVYYEKYPFTVRVAYNFNGKYNYQVGDSTEEDTWFDAEDSIDVSLGWTIRRGWQLYLEGKNLQDTHKKRIYLGSVDRPIEQEYAGYSVVGGLKFEF